MTVEGLVGADQLAAFADELGGAGRRIVFTNGCFDLLHPGHLALLEACAKRGDVVVVGINDDASVRRLKGSSRPIYPAHERAEILLALRSVDYVTVFAEETPRETIERLRPSVLVKGAEYGVGEIVGEDLVKGYGGDVVRFPMRGGYATSDIVAKINQMRPGRCGEDA